MNVAVIVASYVLGIAALADALRRPPAAWVEADRSRGRWLTRMSILTLFLLGFVAAIGYAVLVLPAFARTKTSTPPAGDAPSQFKKRPS